RALASVCAAQPTISGPGLARIGPATRVVCTSRPADPKTSRARERNRAAFEKEVVSASGAANSRPSVTALIFTAEMVAPGTGDSVIILGHSTGHLPRPH